MNKMNESKDVLILPNGYGVLSYIETLDKCLVNEYDKRVHIPEFKGTRDIKGVLDINCATASITNKVNGITKINQNSKTVIIAHCSSVLALTNLGVNNNCWKHIKHVIIYGYLANPKKHLERFLKKSEEYGVNLNIKDDFNKINDFTSESLLSIPVSIYVIHPNTTLNKLRANDEELQELSSISNVVSIDKPKNGYEITNDRQYEAVKYIADKFYSILM